MSGGGPGQDAGLVALLAAEIAEFAATSESPHDRSRRYSPVLERMVEILGTKGNERGVSFGQALERASSELNIRLPEDIRMPILRSAFIIIGGKRIPGNPEA